VKGYDKNYVNCYFLFKLNAVFTLMINFLGIHSVRSYCTASSHLAMQYYSCSLLFLFIVYVYNLLMVVILTPLSHILI